MAKLSAHGTELYRYFSSKKRGLMSVRSDGTALVRRPGAQWKICYRKKKDDTLAEWQGLWAGIYERLPAWKKEVQNLPTLEQLRQWTFDSVCETTDGAQMEPDFRGDAEHGPSWLVALGYV